MDNNSKKNDTQKTNSIKTNVIFSVDKVNYGISAEFVMEIINIEEITKIANMPNYIRGVSNLRGKVIPIMDFRTKIGLKSLLESLEDFNSMLDQREQDHINWLHKLDDSIKEGKEFKLATDPHKCAFGKWYDSYSTDDHQIKAHLEKFDNPHKIIHSIAVKCLNYEKEGNHEKANEIIENTRNNELAKMKKLFSEFKELLLEKNKTVTMIINDSGTYFGLIIDEINIVKDIEESEFEQVPSYIASQETEFVKNIVKSEIDQTEKVVFIVDPSMLMDKHIEELN